MFLGKNAYMLKVSSVIRQAIKQASMKHKYLVILKLLECVGNCGRPIVLLDENMISVLF